ncbi:hypothetical protein FKG94_14570 [Exilibacterium tricleocarpae]|uniref:VanZ-like domain-containing protein n=1 Tax=Exilibacterium tricleocarpae TaxID=2591008 RepID=A0A545TK47_9GAMM|nr:VanZ family protein [Exilibacterium tricleocarpae]TQV77599.1 hypothetical protein FKG94_14570 [Exilibacterium tricleocarpae]
MRPISGALRNAQFLLLLSYASYLHLTPSPGAVFVSIWDKALHVVCWLVLTLSLQIALAGVRTAAPLRLSAQGAMALLVYSALLDMAQHWVPGRHFSPQDILANAVGIALGLAFIGALYRLKAR